MVSTALHCFKMWQSYNFLKQYHVHSFIFPNPRLTSFEVTGSEGYPGALGTRQGPALSALQHTAEHTETETHSQSHSMRPIKHH